MNKKTYFSILCLLSIMGSKQNNALAQCANESNIYGFIYESKSYELVRENKSWMDAASCAVERGGHLAEINDANEQNAIFAELIGNASIPSSNTIAPDGGDGSYVWIGGNDIANEGNWIWDGDNSQISLPFWFGNAAGNAVNSAYTNWGNEPDNWGSGTGQDGLGLAVTDWPRGLAGQWNDIKHSNALYFLIEYGGLLQQKEIESDLTATISPNPASSYISILNNTSHDFRRIFILNSLGQQIYVFQSPGSDLHEIDISNYMSGIYFVRIEYANQLSFTQKIIKE